MDKFCEVIISSLMTTACLFVIWYMPKIASACEWIEKLLSEIVGREY